jgi:hypothetical protein
MNEERAVQGVHLDEFEETVAQTSAPADAAAADASGQREPHEFAPGDGELEEELLDDEDSEYSPLRAVAGDEDMEEETLENAADLGTMLREKTIWTTTSTSTKSRWPTTTPMPARMRTARRTGSRAATSARPRKMSTPPAPTSRDSRRAGRLRRTESLQPRARLLRAARVDGATIAASVAEDAAAAAKSAAEGIAAVEAIVAETVAGTPCRPPTCRPSAIC